MNVEWLAKVFATHRRALNMPTRSPRSPRTLPGRFSWFAALPQGKIHRVMLAFIDFNSRTSHHVVEPSMRELAVAGEFINGKIDIIRR
jgi:hypothetical protein